MLVEERRLIHAPHCEVDREEDSGSGLRFHMQQTSQEEVVPLKKAKSRSSVARVLEFFLN